MVATATRSGKHYPERVSIEALLSAFDVGGRSAAEQIGTEALLFQTGYLTITGEEELGGKALYRLGYPNGSGSI